MSRKTEFSPVLLDWRNKTMNEYLRTLVLLTLLTMTFQCTGCFLPVSASGQITRLNYSGFIDDNADWIAGCQRDTGAICIYRDKKEVIPYFSHIAAIGLCCSGGHREDVEKWMVWYLTHLNSPDHHGLNGTVYDYRIVDGAEIPTGDYDSADSYAALFLTLCREYCEKNGDAGIVAGRKDDLVTIANVITGLQQPDGLTWAKPDYRVKYLMDNAECYKGLLDMAWLCDNVFSDPGLAESYRASASRIRNGTTRHLWNKERRSYSWEMDDSGHRSRCSWDVWYPDAESQLWPVWCGMIRPDSRRAAHLFKELSRHHDWTHVTRKKEPASIVGEVSAMMGRKKATVHIRSVAGTYLGRYPWPWNCAESGAFIVECSLASRESPAGSLSRTGPVPGRKKGPEPGRIPCGPYFRSSGRSL